MMKRRIILKKTLEKETEETSPTKGLDFQNEERIATTTPEKVRLKNEDINSNNTDLKSDKSKKLTFNNMCQSSENSGTSRSPSKQKSQHRIIIASPSNMIKKSQIQQCQQESPLQKIEIQGQREQDTVNSKAHLNLYTQSIMQNTFEVNKGQMKSDNQNEGSIKEINKNEYYERNSQIPIFSSKNQNNISKEQQIQNIVTLEQKHIPQVQNIQSKHKPFSIQMSLLDDFEDKTVSKQSQGQPTNSNERNDLQKLHQNTSIHKFSKDLPIPKETSLKKSMSPPMSLHQSQQNKMQSIQQNINSNNQMSSNFTNNNAVFNTNNTNHRREGDIQKNFLKNQNQNNFNNKFQNYKYPKQFAFSKDDTKNQYTYERKHQKTLRPPSQADYLQKNINPLPTNSSERQTKKQKRGETTSFDRIMDVLTIMNKSKLEMLSLQKQNPIDQQQQNQKLINNEFKKKLETEQKAMQTFKNQQKNNCLSNNSSGQFESKASVDKQIQNNSLNETNRQGNQLPPKLGIKEMEIINLESSESLDQFEQMEKQQSEKHKIPSSDKVQGTGENKKMEEDQQEQKIDEEITIVQSNIVKIVSEVQAKQVQDKSDMNEEIEHNNVEKAKDSQEIQKKVLTPEQQSQLMLEKRHTMELDIRKLNHVIKSLGKKKLGYLKKRERKIVQLKHYLIRQVRLIDFQLMKESSEMEQYLLKEKQAEQQKLEEEQFLLQIEHFKTLLEIKKKKISEQLNKCQYIVQNEMDFDQYLAVKKKQEEEQMLKTSSKESKDTEEIIILSDQKLSPENNCSDENSKDKKEIITIESQANSQEEIDRLKHSKIDDKLEGQPIIDANKQPEKLTEEMQIEEEDNNVISICNQEEENHINKMQIEETEQQEMEGRNNVNEQQITYQKLDENEVSEKTQDIQNENENNEMQIETQNEEQREKAEASQSHNNENKIKSNDIIQTCSPLSTEDTLSNQLDSINQSTPLMLTSGQQIQQDDKSQNLNQNDQNKLNNQTKSIESIVNKAIQVEEFDESMLFGESTKNKKEVTVKPIECTVIDDLFEPEIKPKVVIAANISLKEKSNEINETDLFETAIPKTDNRDGSQKSRETMIDKIFFNCSNVLNKVSIPNPLQQVDVEEKFMAEPKIPKEKKPESMKKIKLREYSMQMIIAFVKICNQIGYAGYNSIFRVQDEIIETEVTQQQSQNTQLQNQSQQNAEQLSQGIQFNQNQYSKSQPHYQENTQIISTQNQQHKFSFQIHNDQQTNQHLLNNNQNQNRNQAETSKNIIDLEDENDEQFQGIKKTDPLFTSMSSKLITSSSKSENPKSLFDGSSLKTLKLKNFVIKKCPEQSNSETKSDIRDSQVQQISKEYNEKCKSTINQNSAMDIEEANGKTQQQEQSKTIPNFKNFKIIKK